jgi:tRNA A-37 threonylcarbamoyl transferase component Bud32
MLRTSKIVIAPGWRQGLQLHQLDTVAGVYTASTGQRVTGSGSTEVRQITLDAADASGTAQVIFVKKYWVNRPSQLWSGMLRGTFFGRSKVRQEFENLGRLRRWGLPAPEAIAYGEERVARWLVRSFLISAGIPNPVALDRFIRDRLPRLPTATPADQALRRTLIEALAQSTREMHVHRFVHHDYFWRNIILSGARLDRFWLIDAHKGRVWSPWQEQRSRAKDLAALDAPAPDFFSRSERLRFFLRYCQQARLDGPARDLLRLTLQLAEPMRIKQRKRVEQAR